MGDDAGMLTGIVLAGGRGRRFGDDKLRVTVGGVPLLRRAVERLAPACAEVIVVADPARRVGPRVRALARVVRDELPGAGPLGGLATGLRQARTGAAFVVAADMPFVRPEAARLLARALDGHDAVVPLFGGRAQVLHAVYARRVGELADQALRDGESSIVALLRRLDVVDVPEEALRALDAEGRIFFGVNTREDLARARRWARGGG